MTDPETRAIELEIEVPGTPEQVWEAVATGPGITAWFVPSEVEPRVGGTITQDFGGVKAEGQVTRWEPPHAFAFGGAVDDEPGLAFEYLVEARDGGTCIVRLINTGFGSGEEWDAQYDGMHEGWKVFLLNLRLHLTYFAGQPCRSVIANGMAPGPRAAARAALTGAAGLPADPAVGDRVAGRVDATPVAGEVVHTGPTGFAVRTDTPAPGIVLVGAEGDGEQVMVSLYGYFRGATEVPDWAPWLAGRFPGGPF